MSVLERVINNLNLLEFQDLTTLFDVVTAVQRTEMVMRIVEEIRIYILELGNEGRLISMQLNELIRHIERDGIYLIRDYINPEKDYEEIYEDIQNLTSKELIDLEAIARVLGYGYAPLADTLISPKGYRMLSKIPRIPSTVRDNLINHFENFNGIIDADIDDLDKVEGIGEARAKAIKNGLRRINDQISLKAEL